MRSRDDNVTETKMLWFKCENGKSKIFALLKKNQNLIFDFDLKRRTRAQDVMFPCSVSALSFSPIPNSFRSIPGMSRFPLNFLTYTWAINYANLQIKVET